jgi:hypothetical protein
MRKRYLLAELNALTETQEYPVGFKIIELYEEFHSFEYDLELCCANKKKIYCIFFPLNTKLLYQITVLKWS